MKSGLNKQKAQPLVLMLILTALCLIIALSSWLAGRGTFTLTLTQNLTDASLAWEAGEIPIEDIKAEEKQTIIVFRPNVPGDYTLQFREGTGSVRYDDCIRVMPHGTVYSMRTGHFTGDAGIIGAIALFFTGTALICLIRFFRLKGPAAYSGGAVTAFGAGIFCTVTCVILIRLFVLWITNPAPDQFSGSLTTAASSGEAFFFITSPLLFIFACMMVFGNMALLRHEAFRVENAVGIGIGIVLIGLEVFLWGFFRRSFRGLAPDYTVFSTLNIVVATVFAFFVCALAGAAVCALRAAAQQPEDVHVKWWYWPDALFRACTGALVRYSWVWIIGLILVTAAFGGLSCLSFHIRSMALQQM